MDDIEPFLEILSSDQAWSVWRRTDDLNYFEVTGTCDSAVITPQLLESLRSFSVTFVFCADLRLGQDPNCLDVMVVIESRSGRADFEINVEKEAEDLLLPDDYDKLVAAVSEGQLIGAVGSIPGRVAAFRIYQRASSGSVAWFHSVDSFVRCISRNWYQFGETLYQNKTSSLRVSSVSVPIPSPRLELSGLRNDLPNPEMFWLAESDEKTMQSIKNVLQGPSVALVLLHLANHLEMSDGKVFARFDGVRTQTFDFSGAVTLAVDDHNVRTAQELWRWLDGCSEVARIESARMAITISGGTTVHHLIDNLDPISKTARYLLELSQRDLVVAALQARRDARKAAVEYIAGVSRATSDGINKTIATTIVAVGSLVGLIAGNMGGQLSKGQSVVVASCILLIVLLSWLASHFVYLPHSDDLEPAIRHDVAKSDVALTQEDLDEILEFVILRDAKAKLRAGRLINDLTWLFVFLFDVGALIYFMF